jgi:hypothetical protein
MAIVAIINTETRIVENVVAVEPDSDWRPEPGFEIQSLGENVGIGWSHIDGQWVEPTQPDLSPEA